MCDLELLGPVLGFAALRLSELSNILVAPDHKQAKALLGAALLLLSQCCCKGRFIERISLKHLEFK